MRKQGGEPGASPLFWQLGLVVGDLEAAMDELSRALGLEWGEPRDVHVGEWSLRLTISAQGPPHFELLQGAPGSPWDGAAGSRADHISYWVDDLSVEKARLEAAGAPLVWDGQAAGAPANYHLAPATNLRLEPIDAAYRDTLRTRWDLGPLDDRLPLGPGDAPESGAHPLFWQLGLVVADLEASMEELTRTLGLEWRHVRELRSGGHDIRVALSKQGPPYFELCEGPGGSPWDGGTGSRLDHIAYWVAELASERRRLEALGVPVVWDGEAHGGFVNYHQAPAAGIRLEPVGREHLERLSANWGGIDRPESRLPFSG